MISWFNVHGDPVLAFPGLELEELPETCSLDIADRGGATLEEVGRVMGVSREYVRQIEMRAMEKIARMRGEGTRK